MSIMSDSTDITMSTTKEIVLECIRLRKTIIQPINDRYHGPLDKTTVKNTAFPFVLLLGNHSSGKSSFVNWILKRDIQVSGVAPTDDSFTIIGPHTEDIDRAGPSLLGDPDLGFGGLRHFGPMLMHRTQLKLRNNIAVSDFMIVDTPGMIDSPTGLYSESTSAAGGNDSASGSGSMDRGYDFEGVCRWYAERADVILLFFDPDKPGTTGETLQVLTNSLVGLDHKLHIILNKADQFRKIHDFARAYGSLCWNLSKVIPRKDLPQIHTMCLPVARAGMVKKPAGETQSSRFLGITMNNLGFSGSQSSAGSSSPAVESQFLAQGLVDLEAARGLVEKEVFNAPKRRVDNEISRLADSVYAVLMHCRIVDDIVDRYHQVRFNQRVRLLGFSAGWGALSLLVGGVLVPHSASAGSASSTASTSGAAFAISSGLRAALLTSAAGIVSTSLLHWYQTEVLGSLRVALCSIKSCSETFSRLYARQIAEKDAFTSSLWDSVLERLTMSFSPKELHSVGRVKPADLASLDRLVEEDIANLRRKAFSSGALSPSPAPPVVLAIDVTPIAFGSSSMEAAVSARRGLSATDLSKTSPVSTPGSPLRSPRVNPVLLTPTSTLIKSAASPAEASSAVHDDSLDNNEHSESDTRE